MTVDGFTPLSQRIIAIGLAVLALLLALQLVVTPLAGAIAERRDELLMLREREVRLAAAHDWPDRQRNLETGPPLVLKGSDGVVQDLVTTQLEQLALRQGLTLAELSIDEDSGPTARRIAVRFNVVGPHDAVLALIADIERGRPLMRATSANLTPAPNRMGEISADLVFQAMAAPQ